MALWVVRATYPSGFGERGRLDDAELASRATMLSAGSCGTTSSVFCAEVEADTADEAISDSMVLIGQQATWFGVTGEPTVEASTEDRSLVAQ